MALCQVFFSRLTSAAPNHFLPFLLYVSPKQAERKGEWWLVPDFETEANRDTWSTFGRGSFLGLFVGLVVPVQEIFVFPWLLCQS